MVNNFWYPRRETNFKSTKDQNQDHQKKSFPLFGKIIDVTWKGNDYGAGIVDTISNDKATDNLAEKIGNLEIRTHAKEFQGWTLQVDRKLNWFEPSTTGKDWEDIQKIADYLISLPFRLQNIFYITGMNINLKQTASFILPV